MKCPCCQGKGGEYEPILWDGFGGGPYYPCDFCHDNCSVNIWRWWLWQWECKIKERLRRKKYEKTKG